MVEAECKVKRRIADGGAFSVKEHRAVRADEYILGTDIAVNHCKAHVGGALAEAKERFLEVRMVFRGGWR